MLAYSMIFFVFVEMGGVAPGPKPGRTHSFREHAALFRGDSSVDARAAVSEVSLA
jgi:hypothetical protein